MPDLLWTDSLMLELREKTRRLSLATEKLQFVPDPEFVENLFEHLRGPQGMPQLFAMSAERSAGSLPPAGEQKSLGTTPTRHL